MAPLTRTEAGASIAWPALAALAALAGGGPASAAASDAPPTRAEAEVWLRGEPSSVERVRETVGELLRRNGVAVSWRADGAFRPEQLFEARAATSSEASAGRPVARVWIDIGAKAETKMFLGDGSSRRFVIRRLTLPRGLDEIAREEIGHIVEAAVLTLVSGAGETLSRTEAEAALATMAPARQDAAAPPPPATTTAAAAFARPAPGFAAPPAIEATAVAAVGPYASDPAVVGRIGMGLAVLAGTSGLGAWGELGVALPASHAGAPIAVALDTQSVRAGLAWEWRWGANEAGAGGDPRWSLRAGLGGGVDRIAFRPDGDPLAARPAPGGVFWAPAVRADLVLDARIWRGLRVLVGIPCDVVLADVHYDLVDETGSRRRYFTPFRVRPALSAGLGWRF
jgi:hypothetical protein